MIRAMYWDGVSSSSFTELIKAANNSAELGTIGSSFFKYVQLAEATGAKTRGSRRLIECSSKTIKITLLDDINITFM